MGGPPQALAGSADVLMQRLHFDASARGAFDYKRELGVADRDRTNVAGASTPGLTE